MSKTIETIPAETMKALADYSWPGNIRELENIIERAVILSPSSILQVDLGNLAPKGHLPAEIGREDQRRRKEGPGSPSLHLADAEREHIVRVLDETLWVLGGAGGAASRLGMKRTTLQSKMKKLGLKRPRSG
jgi:formate hydrogenlyase transcriptional activator